MRIYDDESNSWGPQRHFLTADDVLQLVLNPDGKYPVKVRVLFESAVDPTMLVTPGYVRMHEDMRHEMVELRERLRLATTRTRRLPLIGLTEPFHAVARVLRRRGWRVVGWQHSLTDWDQNEHLQIEFEREA